MAWSGVGWFSQGGGSSVILDLGGGYADSFVYIKLFSCFMYVSEVCVFHIF